MKKITFKISSVYIKIKNLFLLFLLKIIKKTLLKYSVLNLPKKIKKITLLKSSHIYKKAREQFQVITYSTALFLTGNEVTNFVKFCALNKPRFVKFKINYF